MKKRVLACLLAVTMVLSTLSQATIITQAEESSKLNPIYTYTGGGFTFEKVSHPSTPVENPDGIVDYLGEGKIGVYEDGVSEIGNGDRGQSYSYASATYGDWVYINTMYGGLGITSILNYGFAGLDADISKAVMDVMYNGNLYYGEPDNYQAGGVLLKFNVKTGETKILMSRELNGLVPTFRNACTMNDKMYFVGMVVDTSLLSEAEVNKAIAKQDGQPCLYEIDPKTDEIKCVYQCVDMDGYQTLVANNIFPSTRAVGVYEDYLVTGGIEAEGSFIAISADPSSGQDSFVRIAEMEDLFNYPAYHRTDVNAGGGIYQVIEYNNSLYVVVCSGSADTINESGTLRSYAIVRGDCNGDPLDADSWTWTAVVGDQENDGAKYTFGIDSSRISAGACTLEVYGDYLYIGEYNDVSNALQNFVLKKSFLTQATNLEQSINLYRMDKNENIEMVVGDANETFPEGSITGLGSGYGNHMNQYTWQTVVYEGKLYVSTMDTTTLLRPIAQFTNGDLLEMSKEEWESQINYIRVLLELMLEDEEPAVMAFSEETVAEEATEEITEEVTEEITEEDAVSMVEAAIVTAEERMAETMPATYADSEDEKELVLTQNQIDELVAGILDGSIAEGQISVDTVYNLSDINMLLDSLTELIDTTDHEAFLAIYEEVVEAYDSLLASISDAIPDSVKGLYNMLISIVTKENIVSIVKSIKYMATSVAGFDLFEIEQSDDGSVTVNTITEDGFGDRYNHGLRIFAKTTDYLLIGTANPFYGTQLWRTANTEPGESDIPVTPDDTETPDDETNTPVNPDESDKPEQDNNGSSDQKSDTVNTGDSANPVMWTVVCMACAVAIVGICVFNKKKKHSI